MAFKGQKVEGGRMTGTGEAGTSVSGMNAIPSSCLLHSIFGDKRVRMHVYRHAPGRPTSHCPAQPGDVQAVLLQRHRFSSFPSRARSDELLEWHVLNFSGRFSSVTCLFICNIFLKNWVSNCVFSWPHASPSLPPPKAKRACADYLSVQIAHGASWAQRMPGG